MSTRLTLVRHGRTDWNATGRCQGHTDVALNAEGRRQASALGARLAAERFDHVFSSPLSRARETARLLGHDAEVWQDLVEIDRGDWEGLPMPEIRRRWPEFVAAWYADPRKMSMPGGESFDALWKRAGAALRRVEALGGSTLLCAHKAILRAIAARALDRRGDQVWGLRQPQAGWSVLVREGGPWRLERLGDVAHLPPELQSQL